MKKGFVKLLAGTVLLSSVVSSIGVISFADTTENVIDNELETILYEKTENPELWIDFIQNQSEDSTGKWLPDLIKKISSQADKELVDVAYKTVTEGFDWGPAINKVVIDFGKNIDASSLDKSDLAVSSNRIFKDMDYSTFTLAEEATEHIVARNITDIYVSDSEGYKSTSGQFVTVEMEVGPTLTEGSPYDYSIFTGFNSEIPTSYVISLNDGAEIKFTNGNEVTFKETSMDEKTGDIKVIADEFVNGNEFSLEGKNLTYSYFVPDNASEENGENPLVIWLHGAGEGGTDTTIPVMGNEVSNLATEEYQEFFGENGAYILAPQAPTLWLDSDGGHNYLAADGPEKGYSYYTETLMALIDEYVAANPSIDTDRIYLGGCSNGGYMTVHMIMEYPEYFAAGFPICEAYSVSWITPEKIEAIADTPIWMVHSDNDNVVKISEGETVGFSYVLNYDENGEIIPIDDFSNALYSRLIEAGAENVYYSRYSSVVDTSGLYTNPDGSPYEYMGHWSWIYALNNECVQTIDGQEITLFEWLGQQ